MEVRDATPADAEALAGVLADCFEGYRAFAPPGWSPPPPERELAGLKARLGQPWLFCQLAVDGGEVAGHVGVVPSEQARWPESAPGLAHLWQLFVRAPWWGSGVGSELHARAIADAAARGCTELRLYTPALQARARRFYEREGWAPRGEPFDEPSFGMALVEYRRPVEPAPR